MYAVTSPEYGVMEVNYMWLPSWVGMNSRLLADMGAAVQQAVVGKPVDEALEVGHEAVVKYLEERYPGVAGLRAYLDGMKSVSLEDGQG